MVTDNQFSAQPKVDCGKYYRGLPSF